MSETNVETNCLDIIEQLRYDRDKYIGMWRSQCNIAEEVMKERDRYKVALNKIRLLTDNHRQEPTMNTIIDEALKGE